MTKITQTKSKRIEINLSEKLKDGLEIAKDCTYNVLIFGAVGAAIGEMELYRSSSHEHSLENIIGYGLSGAGIASLVCLAGAGLYAIKEILGIAFERLPAKKSLPPIYSMRELPSRDNSGDSLMDTVHFGGGAITEEPSDRGHCGYDHFQ